MRYIQNPTGNLMSYSIGSGSQDGHGGHAREHEEQMRAIAQEEIQRMIPEIQRQAYNDAVNDLIAALRMDVESIVSVGLANAGDIFYGKKCQTAIMNAIVDEIVNRLNNR